MRCPQSQIGRGRRNARRPTETRKKKKKSLKLRVVVFTEKKEEEEEERENMVHVYDEENCAVNTQQALSP